MNTIVISTIFSHWNKATVHAIDWGPHPAGEHHISGRTSRPMAAPGSEGMHVFNFNVRDSKGPDGGLVEAAGFQSGYIYRC